MTAQPPSDHDRPTNEQGPSAGFDPVALLAGRVRAAAMEAFPEELGDGVGVDALITPARQPEFGDFQSNAAMPLGKRLGMKPREVATAIVERLDTGGLTEPVGPGSIAGPGFINLTLRPDALSELVALLDTPTLGLDDLPTPEQPGTVVVDLCGVNLAKQMHVGHLRATVIGDAIARLHEALGYRVVRQNHVGDWGLPIAMVARRLMDEQKAGRLDLDTLDLDTLEKHYRNAQRDAAADRKGLAAVVRFGLGPKAEAELEEQVAGAEEELARARETLVKLQAQEPETLGVWERIYEVTMSACLDNCARLHANITEEASAGESSYRDELPGVVEDLSARSIAEEDDGALIIRNELDGKAMEPTLVRKSDGGFLYATTDLAAIRRRVQTIGASRVVYCVDARQSLHFRQVFASAARAGYATVPGTDRVAELRHAAFGTVLGEDGRPFKTRSGDNVKLRDLIDEAVDRSARLVAKKSPHLDEEERARVAERVAIAAIKHADLSSDRIKDYVFSFDRMVSFEGNTGPYLLYALVRIRSIFRKAAEQGTPGDAGSPLLLGHHAEKTLALELLRYPRTIRDSASALEPHRVCAYLYELAGAFSRFFEKCPVLRADTEELRASRLRLCDLTARVLEGGLDALGIPTLDRM